MVWRAEPARAACGDNSRFREPSVTAAPLHPLGVDRHEPGPLVRGLHAGVDVDKTWDRNGETGYHSAHTPYYPINS